MPTQIWIIEGTTYPPAPLDKEFTRTELHLPFPIAFFCPFCGEVWARRVVLGGYPEWTIWQRPCSKHPHSISRGLSGSVWIGFDSDSDRNLPKPVLHREALIHIGANNPPLPEPKNHD